LSFILLALGSGGCATTSRDSGRAGFDQIDYDRNGAISADEFATHLIHESFRSLDANGDKAIQFAEWRVKEPEAGSVALFETLDLNADGQLEFEEFDSSDRKRDALARMFHTLDRNDDGLLEWTEVRGR
jgi:Ca2+-binding EF-hand superfamily protein